jgi:hypothetical protein
MNPFEPIDRAKAERMAKRRNQRRRQSVPLFAQDVDLVTPEQLIETAQGQHDRFEACLRGLQATADDFRQRVAALVPAEELQRLDERRQLYPHGEEYSASFWRLVYQRLKGGT